MSKLFSYYRFRIALVLGNFASYLSTKFARGSGEQIKGRVINAISKDALKYCVKDKEIVVISATNGKTSMTRLIAQAVKEQYGSVISNALGANQKAGVIAALTSKDSVNAEYAILEIDERSLPGMFDDLSPDVLVLGNLSRDQLDRFGEVNSIATSWKKMLVNSDTYIVANASDPNIVYAVNEVNESNIEYVDIESNWHDDANTCNICGSLLLWTESNYKCSNCDFRKPENVVYTKVYDSIIESNLALPGTWNVSNAKLALCALVKIGVDTNSIKKSWPNVKEVAGRNAIFNIGKNKTLQLFLAKNPAGYNVMLKHISNEISKTGLDDKCSTIFAFNCNIADGKDPSWLYDVRFEEFSIGDCFTFGQRALDITLRLKIADKNVKKVDNLKQVFEIVSDTDKYYLIASYTQFHRLSKSLAKQYSYAETEEDN